MDRIAFSPLDISIIVDEIVLVMIVGMWISRRTEKSVRGFFLAGGKMPW
jgi:hypothetical protein